MDIKNLAESAIIVNQIKIFKEIGGQPCYILDQIGDVCHDEINATSSQLMYTNRYVCTVCNECFMYRLTPAESCV